QHAREATKLVGQFAETFFSTTNLTEDLYPESVQGLQDLIASLTASIGEELSRANHDNDIIYNDPVPNTSTLPALEAAVVALHFDINDFYGAERSNVVGGELFTRLIPMAIHEGSSIYSEEKAKMLRAEEDKANLADGELQDALSFMKLPESLRRFDRHQRAGTDSIVAELGEASRAVRDAAHEVQSTERAHSLTDMRATVEAQRVRASDELNQVRRLLDEEQRASESVLSEYASEPLFAGYQPSSRAAAFYREQVAENQKKLDDAAGLDNSILSDYQTVVAPWLPALQNGPDGIASVLIEHFKDADFGDGSGLQPGDSENLVDIGQDQPVGLSGYVQAIQEIYDQLLDLKRVRRSTLNELKAFARDDDISDALVKMSDAKGLQALFERELRKYDNHIQRLQTAASRQGALVKHISEEFRRLLELPQARAINQKWDAAESKKATLESQILEAAQVYSHVRDGLDKANRFYSMMLESLEPFRGQVNEFAVSRAGLREQLIKQAVHESASRNQAMLQERLSQYSASSHQQQPQQQPAPEHPQAYQPATAQPSYLSPQQQHYQPAQSPVRAADPYDVGHLTNQAAHLSMNSPSTEHAQPPPQVQQQSYSYGGPQAPQYQPSAPSPIGAQQLNYMQQPPQHEPQYPQQQQQPTMHNQYQQHYQPQYQPQPQQAHSASGREYQQAMQAVDPGYPPANVAAAAGQYGMGHAPPAAADPYSSSVRRSTALEPGPATSPANPSYKPVYGSYPPAAAPIQLPTSQSGGYGGMSGPYMSNPPEMSMSSPAHAAVAPQDVYQQQQQQQPQPHAYGEAGAPMAASQATHPVTAQPPSNGYSAMVYPPASQGLNTSYTNIMGNSSQAQPPQFHTSPSQQSQQSQRQQQQQPAPQMSMATALEPQQYKPQPQQASPYHYQPPVDARPTPYGAPQGQSTGQPGPAGYQQQPYMQGPQNHQPPPLHQQQPYGSQPPAHYPPPQQHISQPPHGYSYAYSTPQYAPVSAPYGVPPVQSMAPQAAPQYNYSQPGYAPAQQQPHQQHQQPPQMQQNERQYQHGYGGNVGSLMD
ncbi:bck1-like resistance to osmotic shock, partial [Coemansia sp. RSA 2708]